MPLIQFYPREPTTRPKSPWQEETDRFSGETTYTEDQIPKEYTHIGNNLGSDRQSRRSGRRFASLGQYEDRFNREPERRFMSPEAPSDIWPHTIPNSRYLSNIYYYPAGNDTSPKDVLEELNTEYGRDTYHGNASFRARIRQQSYHTNSSAHRKSAAQSLANRCDYGWLSDEEDSDFLAEDCHGPPDDISASENEQTSTRETSLQFMEHRKCGDCRSWAQRVYDETGFQLELAETQLWWECHRCKESYNIQTTSSCFNPECAASNAAARCSGANGTQESCDWPIAERPSTGTWNDIFEQTKDDKEVVEKSITPPKPNAVPDFSADVDHHIRLDDSIQPFHDQTINPLNPPNKMLATDNAFGIDLEDRSCSTDEASQNGNSSNRRLQDHEDILSAMEFTSTKGSDKPDGEVESLDSPRLGPAGKESIESVHNESEEQASPVVDLSVDKTPPIGTSTSEGGIKGLKYNFQTSFELAAISKIEVTSEPKRATIDHDPSQDNKPPACSPPKEGPGAYYCTVPSCKAQFSHLKDRRRHEATVHNRSKEHLCLEGNCVRSKPDNGFSRRDNLRTHMKAVHGKTLENPDKTLFPQSCIKKRSGAFEQVLFETSNSGLAVTVNEELSMPSTSQIDITAIKALQTLMPLTEFTFGTERSPNASCNAFCDWKKEHLKRPYRGSWSSDRKNERSQPPIPSLDSTQTREDDLFYRHKRLQNRAKEAFEKLQAASSYKSDEFKRFVSDLKDVDNILKIGYRTLSAFIDDKKKNIPDDLKSLYCMLHLCYAMSQSTENGLSEKEDVEFAKSASEWKGCLPAVSNTGIHEQDLFDELVSVMWAEIQEGFECMENLDQDMLLELYSSILDPSFNMIGDFNTDDPLFDLMDSSGWDSTPPFDPRKSLAVDPNFSLSVLSSVKVTALGTPQAIAPSPSLNSTKPTRPSWESLTKTLFITITLDFFNKLRETSNIFLYICGTIEASGKPVSERRPPDLNLDQRHDVLNFLEDSLCRKLLPILCAVSDHFLAGIINSIRDLEECMVAFLMACCSSPHTFLCFFSDIISRFALYYHTRFPPELKCTNDVYNSATYVSDRIREEERSIAFCAPLQGLESHSSNEIVSPVNPSSKPGQRKLEQYQEDLQSMEQPSRKRPKLDASIAIVQESKAEYRWKNTTGRPRKRQSILKQLPRATPRGE